MKTFKLVSLVLFNGEQFSSFREEIPLIDGLIINKEDGENRWLMEAYLDKNYFEIFNRSMVNNEELQFQIKISHKSNDPASLHARVKEINEMEHHISVLFDGVHITKIDLAEIVLSELIDQGLEGANLLQEFRVKMVERRGLPAHSK